MNTTNFIDRLWKKDSTLWTQDPDTAEKIQNRLGWLDSIDTFETKLIAIRAFADSVPYKDVVLLGMGGSSLISKVWKQILPNQKRNFYVLDTTDPETILTVQNKINLEDTLFIAASKSGTTIEMDCLLEYFFNLRPSPEQFIAITDFNTPLMRLAEKRRFRHTFINPVDIGGRYSALSYFGLIPFALMGGDVISLFEHTKKTITMCKTEINNPALKLAATLFEKFKDGKNKLFFNTPETSSKISLWIEQLVAESTGKQGLGLIPIHAGKASDDGFSIDININNIHDIGSQCFIWMMATALLGSMKKINPFDEPNVVESKKNTTQYLQSSFPHLDIEKKIHEYSEPIETFETFFSNIQAPEFVAILAYTPEFSSVLDNIKSKLSNIHTAISICYGPNYLHSTGQLHKGGVNQGRYLILIDDQKDLAIPGKTYGFQTLKLAQALGDYTALKQAGRKVCLVKI